MTESCFSKKRQLSFQTAGANVYRPTRPIFIGFACVCALPPPPINVLNARSVQTEPPGSLPAFHCTPQYTGDNRSGYLGRKMLLNALSAQSTKT